MTVEIDMDVDKLPGIPSVLEPDQHTIVIMLSGGLDSVAALYRTVTDDAYKGLHVHAHHVRLYSVEHRFDAEYEAVKSVMAWFDNWYPGAVGFSVSHFQVPQCGTLLFDNYATKFVGGYFASHPLIRVGYGVTADDRDHNQGATHLQKGFEIWNVFATEPALYPVQDWSKAECWNNLPPDLRELTWSCRRPVRKSTGFEPCNRCWACKELDRIKSND